MKKTLILLTIISVMLLSALNTMAAGGVELPMIPIGSEFSISSTDAVCAAGGSFDITVTVDKNPGLKKAVFEILCPDGITLNNAEKGIALGGLTMTVDKTAMKVTFEGQTSADTGELMTLSFSLANTASKSEYSITVRATELEGNGYVAGTSTVSKVTVEDVLAGDTNNDGVIDLKDVTVLRRWLAGGYGVSIQEAASDVNGDGVIDLKDVTFIRRALAGGYGLELQSVVTYTVVGTENCGTATGEKDVIAVAKADSNDSPVTVKVSDIRLESYVGKTDDLMNYYLDITVLGQRLTKAVIKSSYRDIISVDYDSTETFITIDGKRYTADSVIPFCDTYGAKRQDITVFGGDNKLTSGFKNLIAKAFKGRAVDYDGDGSDDIFMIVPKVAYSVEGFVAKEEIKYVNCTALDFSSTLSLPVSCLTATVEKGDVFVGALYNTTLYTEKATPVETYATGFGINGKVNLKNVGAVRFENVTVTGARKVNITANDFGADNIRCYYVYKNELLGVSGQKSEYNFAVLCDVEKNGSTYTANILVPKDGELVKEQLLLHPAVAESLYSQYKLTYSGNKPLYKYTIISGYIQTGEGCMLMINEKPDDSFITIPKGATFSYDSEDCIYTLDYNGSTAEKVFLDDTSSVFYKYTIAGGESAGFLNVRMYTKDTISNSSFTVTTADTSYLINVNGCYVLIATMVEGKIQ